MVSLPSIHSSNGLAREDQNKTITVGTRTRRNSTYSSQYSYLKENDEYPQDVEMMAVDEMEEAQTISDFVTSSRIGSQMDASDEMELDKYMLQTTQVSLQGNVSYLIIDTNFLISHLSILDSLNDIATRYGLVIVIPIQVIRELDGLKSSFRRNEDTFGGSQDISRLARAANDWIFNCLAQSCPTVKGQGIKERIDKFATKDDAILDCCLYYKAEYQQTLQVLFSNDKNLCSKALSNNVLTVSYQKDMSPQLIAEKIYEENMARFGYIEPASAANVEVEVSSNYTGDPGQIYKNVYAEIEAFAGHVVGQYMLSEYGEDIELLHGYDGGSLSTLFGTVSTIIRFWRPVFSRTLRGHEPFEEYHNRQTPAMIDVPQSNAELVKFIGFWAGLMLSLYEDDNSLRGGDTLRENIKRWNELASSAV